MPPRDPKPANSRRKSKPKLEAQEPALTKMLEQYCELRRRGFTQQAILTKPSWTKNHQKLLLEEAQRREMPGSQKSQAQAVTEWLLQMFDAGTELSAIQRASAYTALQTKKRLETALDAVTFPLDAAPRVSYGETVSLKLVLRNVAEQAKKDASNTPSP